MTAQGAKFIDLDIVFTDPTLVDTGDLPFLVPGSFCFVEPGHPWAPQHLTNKQAATLPNLAFGMTDWSVVAPGATSSNTGMTLSTAGSTPGYVGSEMTAKGGLHGIAANTVFNAHVYQGAAASVLQSLIHSANGHKFYVAMSHRVTRPKTGTGGDSYGGITSANTRAFWNFSAAGDLPATGNARSLGATHHGATDSAGGLIFRSVGLNGTGATSENPWLASNNTTAANPDAFNLWKVGSNANWEVVSGSTATKASHILYFVYIEDLTASGRTFADADAALYAYHQRIHGVGGRYNGDTWTDPASFAL